MAKTARTVLVGVVLVAAVAWSPGPGAAPPAGADRSSGTGTIPESIIDRYLSTRPPLGEVTVVDIVGEPGHRKLLAAVLQGVVNRSEVRIYLVGARAAEQDRFWLDDYVARDLIDVVATVDLDTALAQFAHELSGYVVADTAEPWTLNTATTAAAVHGALVALPSQAAQLQLLGLTEIDDHRGRWPDAATAYAEIAATEGPNLAYEGIAIQQPTWHNPRDFYVQQGIMTVYTRPSHPDYDQIMSLLDPYPDEHPVYGYVSDDGTEEVLAILRLSQSGRFLIPTDTTDNLSFHIAVAASSPRTVLRADTAPVAECSAEDVNVVIATSDGDNMVIPEAYLPAPEQWNSPRRGTLPIGWGITPATAVLMPAVWDWYAAEATAADEVVGLVGIGYAAPSLMPDPASFLTDSNRLAAAVGVDTVWSLDLLLSDPAAAGWADIAAANAATSWRPDGMLLNYENFGDIPFFTAAELPVLASVSSDYDAGADAIAAHIDTLMATPAEERPLVSFFPATVWNADYDQLVTALEPHLDAGVRFLTPRQAFACVAPPTPEPTTPAEPTTTGAPSTGPPLTVAPTTGSPTTSVPGAAAPFPAPTSTNPIPGDPSPPASHRPGVDRQGAAPSATALTATPTFVG